MHVNSFNPFRVLGRNGLARYNNYIEKWKNGKVTGLRGKCALSSHIKRYIWIKYNHRCAICGWAEVNPYSGLIPLEIEHINGDWQNNDEDNLTLLCPNHHSLTATYKNLNKGHGRTDRVRIIYRDGGAPIGVGTNPEN